MRILLAVAFYCCVVSLAAFEWENALSVRVADDAPLVLFADAPPAEPQLLMDKHEHATKVFLWQSVKGLHLRLLVDDESCTPSDEIKWLWKSDCVYLEIDGHGDNPDRYGMGSDDLQLFFALSASSPHGKISDHGLPHLRGSIDESLFEITYDAEHQQFTYEICVPWNVLNSGPGISNATAIAINVAHKGADKTDNILGDRSNKSKGTRKLIPLRLEKPIEPMVFVGGFDEQPLLSPKGSVSIPIFIKDDKAMSAHLEMGEQTIVSPKFIGKSFMAAFAVVKQSDLAFADRLNITFGEKSFERRFSSLQQQHTEIMRRLNASDLSNPLAALHVDSLKTLATDCINRSNIFHHNDPAADYNDWLTKIFKWQSKLLMTLPPSGFNLQQHLISGKPLALAFVSESDGSLQFASLQLPHDFDATRIYPLVCYLHGYGPKTPVDYLNALEDNSGQDTLWLEGADEAVLHSGQRQCILLSPFGRGSIGYTHQAEKDVWQVLEITQRYFRIDENKRYMSGFSMGCDGAFALAAHRPDYWAAVNLSAGFHARSACWNEKLYLNMKELPLIVWCGDQDKMMFGGYQSLLPIWSKHGIKPQHQTIAPGLPHTYPYYSYSAMLHECFKYSRQPVESFTYRIPENDGSNWQPVAVHGFSPLIQDGVDWNSVIYSVNHSANVLSISTEGQVAGFDIQPQAFGNFAPSLDAQKAIRVIYKNQELYAGPVTDSIRVILPQKNTQADKK